MIKKSLILCLLLLGLVMTTTWAQGLLIIHLHQI